MIAQGIVSSIEADGVRVAAFGLDGYVTLPLAVPKHLHTIRVGQKVAFVEFSDQTGAVLCELEE